MLHGKDYPLVSMKVHQLALQDQKIFRNDHTSRLVLPPLPDKSAAGRPIRWSRKDPLSLNFFHLSAQTTRVNGFNRIVMFQLLIELFCNIKAFNVLKIHCNCDAGSNDTGDDSNAQFQKRRAFVAWKRKLYA